MRLRFDGDRFMIDTPETNTTNRSHHAASRPTIGLMVHRLTDSHGSELWSGIMAAVRDLDVNLLCFRGNFIDVPEKKMQTI